MLTQVELLRYERQLPLIARAGQEKLKQARVLCIGAGGLGSAVLQYLAAVGVGVLGIVDDDRVALNNLHRQVLFTHAEIGLLKAECAAQRLRQQNPHCACTVYPVRLNEENAQQILPLYDWIVDGSDNYATRYLINDVCHRLQKPLLSASILQFQGQIGLFNYQQGPCYRCLYHQPPPAESSPNCTDAGVIGTLPGIVGSIQANELIKLITGVGKTLEGRLLTVDALTMEIKDYQIQKNPDCPLCVHAESARKLFAHPSACGSSVTEIEPAKLAQWLQSGQPLELIDVREADERAVAHIGGRFMPMSGFTVADLDCDKQTPIVVYCRSGGRSMKIAKLLAAAGYVTVYSLKGGMMACQDFKNTVNLATLD